MDCKTGNIYYRDDLEAMRKLEDGRQLCPLTDKQAGELEALGHRQRKNNMRNKPCVCGSGRKFKRCCWGDYT